MPQIDMTYMKLPPALRQKYVHEVVKETVFENRDGVSVTQLEKILPFSRKVIQKTLEKLVSVNQCYSKQYGQVIVYFPNSRAIHATAELESKINGKKFRAVEIQNPLGVFLYIQEYEEGFYGEEVKGGLMIPVSTFEQFVNFIQKIMTKLKSGKNESK